ncbi:hypothetical protein E2C01_057789 [Portunus trituberculatus]|uniref:MULE transposase domain-containing protein n=1 Tax=Portunus trituberculatus TaxID=210409 RepID=A0A5B7H2Y9_PORTR|nr:hypothetical protein [Portunus trituberculatus]
MDVPLPTATPANRVQSEPRALAVNFIPDEFLVDDIRTVCGQRHLLFSTPEQLDVLSKAKKWYIDAAFKIVLKSITRKLPVEPAVVSCVADFERGIWHAMRRVFPQATMMSCAFQWCQAVWRKACDLGLRTAHLRHEGVHRYNKNVFGTPLPPC